MDIFGQKLVSVLLQYYPIPVFKENKSYVPRCVLRLYSQREIVAKAHRIEERCRVWSNG